jgi:exodeoxyribonuclease V alpha subunit
MQGTEITAHKHLVTGTPGIAICAYTRRATNNIRRNQSKELENNCITIHKLLQYQPEDIETEDPDTGITRTTRQFKPFYNADNPLPTAIKVIIIEEASMVGMDLWNALMAAIQHEVQFIFLGDLNQLPPVFGLAILGFKLLALPVTELTEVYRQALESPIISLAHRILSGKPIELEELTSDWAKRKGLKIVPWQKKISPDNATSILAQFFVRALNSGDYDPLEDGILIPFNKSCGTDELNAHIANAVAKQEQKPVYEIAHKWKKSYYSIGDKCLYEKEDATILEIYENVEFSGNHPRPASIHLDYWGNDLSGETSKEEDMDVLLHSIGTGSSDEESRNAASHVIKLQLHDSDRTIEIRSAGQIEALTLGYAITVHKSQGSEWRRVFLCFHHSHATMMQRELLYTAVTRAKEELVIVCEPTTFVKGIENAKIKGLTLEEKAEYFKGKQSDAANDARSDGFDRVA